MTIIARRLVLRPRTGTTLRFWKVYDATESTYENAGYRMLTKAKMGRAEFACSSLVL
jgi:hypothetical protein